MYEYRRVQYTTHRRFWGRRRWPRQLPHLTRWARLVLGNYGLEFGGWFATALRVDFEPLPPINPAGDIEHTPHLRIRERIDARVMPAQGHIGRM